jgi:hypothetical protein
VTSGCNQIHGTKHNPFVKLARLTKTATFLEEHTHSISLKDGTYLQGAETRDLWLLKESLLDKAIAHSQANGSHIDPNVSLRDWSKNEVIAQGLSPSQQDRVLQVVQEWGAFVGEDIRTQSLENLWLETSLPGGQ